MLKGLVDIPVYPLKGYSLTIPIAEEDGAPVSTYSLDETYNIAITRFRPGAHPPWDGGNRRHLIKILLQRRKPREMVVSAICSRAAARRAEPPSLDQTWSARD